MTVRELIEELKNYHDQDSDVVVFGMDIKKIGICETGKYAEIFVEYPYLDDVPNLITEVDEAVSNLEYIDLDDIQDDDTSEYEDYIDSAISTLDRVSEFLECML